MFDKKAVSKNKWMIDPDDAVMLLIDHQSGLLQLVRDIEQPVLDCPRDETPRTVSVLRR